MAMSREQARKEHASQKGHEQFNETIYGVICATCHNYILIDKTNCAPTCREHEACRQAYSS
jgi:cytochrome c5